MARYDEKTTKRFMDKVVLEPSGCWRWISTMAGPKSTYGQFAIKGKKIPAHRVAYVMFVGEIPTGLELDHLCRNRWCVNPAHLEPVTHTENMQRGSRAMRAHCIRGHKYTPENIYTRKNRGGRECKECNRLRKRVIVR